MRVIARRGRIALGVGLLALLTAGCVPNSFTFTPTGGGGTCPDGSWHLSSSNVIEPLQTMLGDLTITPSGNGIDLTVMPGSPNTWLLTVDQTLTVSGANVNGTVTVAGAASGTYTAAADSITFTLGALNGTASFDGTAFGHAFSGSWSLPQSGEITQLYGLSGTASVACNANGTLTLTFPSFGHGFRR
jgi:hypothetical protein